MTEVRFLKGVSISWQIVPLASRVMVLPPTRNSPRLVGVSYDRTMKTAPPLSPLGYDVQSPDNPTSKADRKANRLILLLLGGLLIGLATSLPLAVGWQDAMRPPVGICLSGTEANHM